MTAAFDKLLAVLDADPTLAASRYREMRRRLVRLFAWRGATDPEELADETLERVATRLGQGVSIREDDPYRYVCGVAYRVFKESLRAERRERETVEASSRQLPRAAEPAVESDERLACLHRCLDELATTDRELILTYYAGEKRDRIEGRRRLAERLEVGLNALRIRAHRIRGRLETCVAACRRQGETDARRVK